MEQSTLTKWESYIQPPTDETVQAQMQADEDSSAEDYTVTTSGLVTTSSIIKLGMVGGFCVLLTLVVIGVLYFMSANSTSSAQARKQQKTPPPANRMEKDKDNMLANAQKRQTFSDRQDTIEAIENQNKGKPKPANTPAAQPTPAAPPPTVTAPRVIFRNRPQAASRPRYVARSSQPQRTFRVQRPATVAAQPEPVIDDPNYGFFTAPPAAASPAPKGGIQLTKSKHLALSKPKTRKGMVRLFNQPVQVASTSSSIPVPQNDGIRMVSNLSGNLTNPYLKHTIARATQGVIPVDTVINARIKTRVSWPPENPGLANGKEIRMVLNDDVRDTSGTIVARKGDVVLGRVNQATQQGLTSVTVSKIGNKMIQPGSIEVHQDGDPTLQARLETKGGRKNNLLKMVVGMGADGVQTLTRSLNQPTSQTSFNNGNQTFLSSSNNNTNHTAAFIEGASSRVGEMIRESDTGPTQSAVGVYRLKGNVQLYVVREVQL